jgi:hypothetical protein
MNVLRAFIVVGASAFALFIFVPSMLTPYATSYTGFHAGPIGTSPGAIHVTVDRGSPAYSAGVRSGDTVACLSWHDSEVLYPTFQAPAYTRVPLHGCVVRNGAAIPVTVIAKPGPPPASLYGSWALAFVRFLSFLVFLIVSSSLVLLRPSLMTWLFFVTSIFSGPYAASQDGLLGWPASAYTAVELVSAEAIALSSAFLLLFTIAVPDRGVPKGWRRLLFTAVCTATMACAAYAAYVFFHGTSLVEITADPGRRLILRAFTYTTIVIVLVRLFTMRREERARFGWVAFGIVIGVLANDLRNQVSNDIVSNGAGVLTVAMPLSLMYAILRRHLIDVRFVISRTVVYGAITTLVIGIIAAVDWATTQYLSQMRAALAIEALVAIALGVVLHRMYGPIETFVDFLIYRRKHEAEMYLNRLAKTLLHADKEETIDAAIVQAPFRRLRLTVAALFRAEGRTFVLSAAAGFDGATRLLYDKDHELVRFLATERAKLAIRELGAHFAEPFDVGHDPAIAIPILQGDDLTAFAVYGVHHDGTKLDPDEIETLEHLCDVAAQAYVRIELLRYRATSPVAVPS